MVPTDDQVSVTFLAISGNVVAERVVSSGHTIGKLREDLATTFGYPPEAIKLLDGAGVPNDSHAIVAPPTSITLSVAFAAPALTGEALLTASRLGHTAHVGAILAATRNTEEGLEILRTTNNHGSSALHLAVSKGHFSVLEVLLAYSPPADLLSTNNQGYNALHYSAKHGHQAAMAALLTAASAQEGAALHLLHAATGKYGSTPLHLAAQHGKETSLEVLLSVATPLGTARQLLLAGDEDGETPLHYATVAGQRSFVRCLLDISRRIGARSELLRRRGGRPSRLALHAAAGGGFSDIVQSMIEAAEEEGVDVARELLLSCDGEGCTSGQDAWRSSHMHIWRWLKEAEERICC